MRGSESIVQTVRRPLKSAIERGLWLSGVPRLMRRRRRADVLILAYHNIVPHGAPGIGDRSLHLSQKMFAAHLDALRASHDVISLEEALRDPDVHRRRAGVVITFDDAYRGAVTVGVAELEARGMPATIFVPPAFVGDGVFWWDALTPHGAPGLAPAMRARALHELAGKGELILARTASGDRCDPVPEYARGASEDELRRAIGVSGITLGSHTWSHPNLAALAPAELEDELVRPLVWLRSRFDAVVPYLSFPYGLSTPAVERAAEAAGYRGALRIEGGWLLRGWKNPYALPRLNIPAGLSETGFRLRCAGLLS